MDTSGADEHLRRVGTMAVIAGALESSAQLVLSLLLSVDSLGAMTVYDQVGGFARSLDLARVLGDLKLSPDGEGRALLTPWVAEAKQAMKHRNRYVHGSWYANGTMKLTKAGMIPVPAGDYKAALNEIQTACDHAIPLIRAINRETGGIDGLD